MPPATGRQAARTQAARDAIVHAAFTVFALKGYSAASMDDVCLAAGCSKGGLYHHFRTKSAVLSGVVDMLAASGALLPFGVADSRHDDATGRILIEIWAEAARNESLRTQLHAGYDEQLNRALEGGFETPSSLALILRIGSVIQLLTRSEGLDPREAARRLGIDRAA